MLFTLSPFVQKGKSKICVGNQTKNVCKQIKRNAGGREYIKVKKKKNPQKKKYCNNPL